MAKNRKDDRRNLEGLKLALAIEGGITDPVDRRYTQLEINRLQTLVGDEDDEREQEQQTLAAETRRAQTRHLRARHEHRKRMGLIKACGVH